MSKETREMSLWLLQITGFRQVCELTRNDLMISMQNVHVYKRNHGLLCEISKVNLLSQGSLSKCLNNI